MPNCHAIDARRVLMPRCMMSLRFDAALMPRRRCRCRYFHAIATLTDADAAAPDADAMLLPPPMLLRRLFMPPCCYVATYYFITLTIIIAAIAADIFTPRHAAPYATFMPLRLCYHAPFERLARHAAADTVAVITWQCTLRLCRCAPCVHPMLLAPPPMPLPSCRCSATPFSMASFRCRHADAAEIDVDDTVAGSATLR